MPLGLNRLDASRKRGDVFMLETTNLIQGGRGGGDCRESEGLGGLKESGKLLEEAVDKCEAAPNSRPGVVSPTLYRCYVTREVGFGTLRSSVFISEIDHWRCSFVMRSRSRDMKVLAKNAHRETRITVKITVKRTGNSKAYLCTGDAAPQNRSQIKFQTYFGVIFS